MRQAPALDYAAYPHIFSLVVANAPWPSLLALRATSSEIRARIDCDLLGRHLLFAPIGTLQYAMAVTGADGHRHPAFAPWSQEWNREIQETDEDDMMDTHSDTPVVFPAHDPSYSLAVMRAAHSLDVAEQLPFVASRDFVRRLGPHAPPVIRHIRAHPSQFQHHQWRSPKQVYFHAWKTEGHFGNCAAEVLHRYVRDEEPQKVVITFTVRPDDQAIDGSEFVSSLWRFSGGEKRKHVELVLTFRTDQAAAASPLVAHSPNNVRALGLVFRKLLSLANVTVVGAEELPVQIPVRGDTPAERRDNLREYVHSFVDSSPEFREDAGEFKVLTMFEYQQTLNAEEFALETIEDMTALPLRPLLF